MIPSAAIEKSSVLDPPVSITSGSGPGLIRNTSLPAPPKSVSSALVRDKRVVAGAADQAVGPRAGHEQVVARAADQRLVATVAVELDGSRASALASTKSFEP